MVVGLVALWLLPIRSAQAAVPFVTSFTPQSGTVGTAVTVTGTGFTGATDVTFDGVAAAFTVDSDTQISTTVPAGVTTGPIAVTTVDGTGTSSTNFRVIVQPVISGFSPIRGRLNTLVTITGSGFTGVFSVRFNGREASFTVVSSTDPFLLEHANIYLGTRQEDWDDLLDALPGFVDAVIAEVRLARSTEPRR